MSFGIPVRNGLGIGLIPSTAVSTLRVGGRPAMSLNFIGTNSLDSRVTFTRATTATFVGSNGLIQTAAINDPRFDYDPATLAAKGLLIEEARTNLALRSNDFANAVWNDGAPNNATVTVDLVSPDGGTNGATLTAATGGTGSLRRQAITAPGATTYAISVFVKKGTATSSRILVRDNTNGTNFIQMTALTWSGSVPVLGGLTGTWTSVNAGNGWYRITGVGTAGAGASVALSASIFPDNAAGTGTLGVYGAQIEAGAFATSYIPTVASTVTRNADVAQMTGTNFSSWYNQAQGAFVVSVSTPYVTPSSAYLFSAGNAAEDSSIYSLINSSSNVIGNVVAGGVSQASMTTSTVTANTAFKTAIAAQINNFAAVLNGGTVATDTAGTMPTVDRLTIGNRATSGRALNGHIRAIAYYNTRLPNATLQVLST